MTVPKPCGDCNNKFMLFTTAAARGLAALLRGKSIVCLSFQMCGATYACPGRRGRRPLQILLMPYHTFSMLFPPRSRRGQVTTPYRKTGHPTIFYRLCSKNKQGPMLSPHQALPYLQFLISNCAYRSFAKCVSTFSRLRMMCASIKLPAWTSSQAFSASRIL